MSDNTRVIFCWGCSFMDYQYEFKEEDEKIICPKCGEVEGLQFMDDGKVNTEKEI